VDVGFCSSGIEVEVKCDTGYSLNTGSFLPYFAVSCFGAYEPLTCGATATIPPLVSPQKKTLQLDQLIASPPTRCRPVLLLSFSELVPPQAF